MKSKKIITWILFFLIFLLMMQLFGKKSGQKESTLSLGAPIAVQAVKKGYVSGQEVIVRIRNNTGSAVTLPSNCPANPFKVLVKKDGAYQEKSTTAKVDCKIVPDITLAPQEEKNITYTYWNHSLFGESGTYAIELNNPSGTSTEVFRSEEFTVEPAGFWRKLFRTVLYQPLYNILVFFLGIAPGRDLGLAIILLTIVIRLILLVPSQRAIVSQRRLQELQPKLEKIKKEYEGNQERIAQETMKVWKENKVNPFGSCLPLLIQFPVLIALFYVIQNGLNPDNTFLLYSAFKDFDLTAIHTVFLGILDLKKVNIFVLPLIVGLLQFLQLKLAAAKKKASEKEKSEKSRPSEMEAANKTMTYIMPVMIALFTASVPAGVGLYWAVSTLFALGQQAVANRR